ncbi:MAG: sugar ABC transporter permease [candidate division KSB1 bacterium]|nr:sugar ABC transporter permease [candidate division KSB1 bacterium]MDZ7273522.1 sugar ABC transporter permease [candidate division KSB1 bacterium]MDZ7286887.1 sugar ABC transporter permease [candidate division KSB1 bacterium]MDZ7299760.1 sugar ABC transporter permease [candidate division KSB1 bacterium]MDZ7308485.1 sugar ABC transporter permease [candidate division KSB1 bacterium]
MHSRNYIGYLFVTPYALHFAIFIGFPLVFSLVLLFHRWDIIAPMVWVGGDNFARLVHDHLFWQAMLNTASFLLLHIPLQIVVALFLALQLNQRFKLRGFFRAAFFLPVVVSGVVVAILWDQLYAQDSGVLNALLAQIGLPKVGWLTDPNLAMPAIALMATWKNVGLYIVLFLVGLQSVPPQLYEAAELDGAGAWQKFRRVTLPLLNPTIFMIVILSTIGGFSLFIEPYVMTGGGPMNRTLSAMLYIYKQGFFFYHMGYAATLGFAFAMIVLMVVLLQQRLVERE